METLQQKFELYVLAHKEELETLVKTMIEEAKSKPFYKKEKSLVPYDCSPRLIMTDYTIGEKCKEDFLVLCADTGNRRPTYMSGYGFYSVTVGDEIEEELSNMIDGFAGQFVADNYEEVFNELSKETDVEEGISSEDLTMMAVGEYGIIVTMFSLMEFVGVDGLLSTLANREELYSDWLDATSPDAPDE